jgi:hypothetical protein
MADENAPRSVPEDRKDSQCLEVVNDSLFSRLQRNSGRIGYDHELRIVLLPDLAESRFGLWSGSEDEVLDNAAIDHLGVNNLGAKALALRLNELDRSLTGNQLA